MTHIEHYPAKRVPVVKMVAGLPRPELALAQDHFKLLYGCARDDDGRICVYTRSPYAIRFFRPSEIEDAVNYACEASQDADVYHPVNLVSAAAVSSIRQRSGRGREAELKSVVAFVAEIDTVNGLHNESGYPTQERALAALDMMPLAPTMINLSGHSAGGLHVYWLFASPVDVCEPDKRQRLKEISQGWQSMLRDRLRPYRLDSTFDLARVLRVAGCLNHKYGIITRPLEIVPSRRYVVSDFAQFVAPQAPQESAAEPLPAGPKRVERCKAYLSRCPDAVSGNGGHEKTFRAACECARFGLSRSEAREVLSWFNDTKTPPGDKWNEQELDHKLHGAYETVKTQGQFGLRTRMP